ncbi:hypothetical protein HDU96_007824 [Phlyctochytrium bullatum]|nr:hypothetical protein HDU96_007824 [Phlyctochytrium bullatum]
MPLVKEERVLVRIADSPKPPPASTLNAIELSPIDIFCGKWSMHVQYIFPPPAAGSEPYSLPKLRLALAETMAHYPSLSGQMRKVGDHGLTVDLTDTGGWFIAASWPELTVAKLCPDQLVRDHDDIPDDLMPPDPEEPYVMALQATILGCGGLALGFNLKHSLFDGEGFFRFVDFLSKVYRGVPDLPVVVNDRSRLNSFTSAPPKFGHHEYKTFVPPTNFPNPPPPVSHKLFHASRTLIDALKAAAVPHVDSANGSTFVSSKDCLQAHVLSLVAAARGLAPDSTIRLNTGVNARRRLSPQLSAWHAGNVILNANSQHPVKDLVAYAHGQGPAAKHLARTAQRVRAAIAVLTPEYAEDAVRFLHHHSPGGPGCVALNVNTVFGPDWLITSWAGDMGLRDPDFGHGKYM